MTDHGLFDVLLVSIIVLPIVDLACTAFLASLYWQTRKPPLPPVPGANWRSKLVDRVFGGGSWLLLLLTVTSTIVTFTFVFFAFLAGRRLLGLPVLNSAPASAVVLLFLGSVPIVKAVVFWLQRRKNEGRNPPPFGDRD